MRYLILKIILLVLLALPGTGCRQSTTTQGPLPLTAYTAVAYLEVNDTLSLSATGGRLPYSYAKVSGPGSVSAAGVFSSSSTGSALVEISDSRGEKVTVTIHVVNELLVTPDSGTIAAFTNQTFLATGGSGSYAFSLVNALNGTIDAVTGVFTRPWASGQVSVKATDTYGLSKTVTLNLAPGSLHWGGTGWDDAWEHAEDSSGNIFLIMGTSESLPGFANAGGIDIGVIKLDKNGSVIWRRQIGGAANDYQSDFLLTEAGDVYFTVQAAAAWAIGAMTVQPGCNLIKVSGSSGAVSWVTPISATITNRCRYYSLVEGDGGHVYWSGQAYAGTMHGAVSIGVQDNFLFKIDPATGVPVWAHFLNTVTNYYSYLAYDPVTESIIFAGVTDGTLPGKTNTGGRDLYVTRWDTGGTRLWSEQWGNVAGWSHYWNRPMVQDGKIIMCGMTGQTWPNSNYFPAVLIFDIAGGAPVAKTYIETRDLTNASYPFARCSLADNGVVVNFHSQNALTGFTSSGGGVQDVYYFKLDYTGAQDWAYQIRGIRPFLLYDQTDDSLVGVIDSATDLTGGGAVGYDTYLMRITRPGAAPTYTAAGITGGTSGNHYWNNFTRNRAQNGYWLWLSSNGTMDGHVNAGSNDIFLLKYNNDLERQ